MLSIWKQRRGGGVFVGGEAGVRDWEGVCGEGG